MTVRPHDLLRVRDPDAVIPDDAPPWVRAALQRTPWVVVRRAPARPGHHPVGVRGRDRAQRFAATVPAALVAEALTPQMLAVGAVNLPCLPAAQTLRAVRPLLDATGWAWGPCGSVGFELATGTATITPESDLDIVIRLAHLPRSTSIVDLLGQLQGLPARVDCQLDTPLGGVALAELAANSGPILLRTANGPRLVTP